MAHAAVISEKTAQVSRIGLNRQYNRPMQYGYIIRPGGQGLTVVFIGSPVALVTGFQVRLMEKYGPGQALHIAPGYLAYLSDAPGLPMPGNVLSG